MAKIINTKVSEKADFKIEDGVIRDSSIGDWSKVHIHDMSELKDVKICGDVDIKHSTIESCKLINCSVKTQQFAMSISIKIIVLRLSRTMRSTFPLDFQL